VTPATSVSLSATTGPWSGDGVDVGPADGELRALGVRRLGVADKVGDGDPVSFATDALGIRDAEMTGPAEGPAVVQPLRLMTSSALASETIFTRAR
jgi:hypothetical protein